MSLHTILRRLDQKLLYGISHDTKDYFFKNILYLSLGIVPGTILSFIFAILSGRLLGPTEYGAFVLLQSVSMYLSMPMLLGLNNAMKKYIAETNETLKHRSIISTTYLLVIVTSFTSLLIYNIFQYTIAQIFSISMEMLDLSFIFSLSYVAYVVVSNVLIGLFMMKKYSVMQFVYSIILLGMFFIFIYFNYLSFKALVYSQILAYSIVTLVVLISLLRYTGTNFDISDAKKLLVYGSVNMIGCLSYTVYTNIDKILINSYLTKHEVGIYSAYSFSSINIALLFYNIFITVFFPYASKSNNKTEILNKINLAIPIMAILIIPSLIIIQYCILYMYGPQYPFNIVTSSLFSLSVVFICLFNISSWLMNAVGVKGVKITASIQVILAILVIIFDLILIPTIGINGAIISLIIAHLVSIIIINGCKRTLN